MDAAAVTARPALQGCNAPSGQLTKGNKEIIIGPGKNKGKKNLKGNKEPLTRGTD